jgi:hypothetical protein
MDLDHFAANLKVPLETPIDEFRFFSLIAIFFLRITIADEAAYASPTRER